MKDARERYKEDPEAMEEDDPDLALSVTSSYGFQLQKAKELYKEDPATLQTDHPELHARLTSSYGFQLQKAIVLYKQDPAQRCRLSTLSCMRV